MFCIIIRMVMRVHITKRVEILCSILLGFFYISLSRLYLFISLYVFLTHIYIQLIKPGTSDDRFIPNRGQLNNFTSSYRPAYANVNADNLDIFQMVSHFN